MAMDADKLETLLRDLYGRCRVVGPEEAYFAEHAAPGFIAAQVRTFLWYSRHLGDAGCLLDWGCHHAPDACLVRAAFGGRCTLYGCDFGDPASYAAFHEFAALRYARLTDPFRLPYGDATFDAAVASGALEHAAMDYESLKELWRCLKPGGVLVITFLPNRWSRGEFAKRIMRQPCHLRRYGRGELEHMLLHTGFVPIEIGYQSRSGALSGVSGGNPLRTAVFRALQVRRLTSCLCAVARKVMSL